MTTLTTETPTSGPSRVPRTAWMIGGGLAIAAAGVGAGFALRPSTEPTTASQVSGTNFTEPGKSTDKTDKPAQRANGTTAQHASTGSTPVATQPVAQVCTHCGVIEGVREVQQKGKGTGLGAVAGGVLGGAVGNQVGKGNGRTAMTVLGAVGGGLAGHEIEKRARAETVYEVRVRMDDGSVRTFTQKTAPAPGARVTVEGNTLHTSRAPQGDAQMVRTSGGA